MRGGPRFAPSRAHFHVSFTGRSSIIDVAPACDLWNQEQNNFGSYCIDADKNASSGRLLLAAILKTEWSSSATRSLVARV